MEMTNDETDLTDKKSYGFLFLTLKSLKATKSSSCRITCPLSVLFFCSF